MSDWRDHAVGTGYSPVDDVSAQREKTERNKRVQQRYDELMREGKHGHYETLFRVVREEVERKVAELLQGDQS